MPSLACVHCAACRIHVESQCTVPWNQMLWSREVTKLPGPLKLVVGYFICRGYGMEKSERKARATRWWLGEKDGGKEP